jgi:hypothetical protein
MGEPVGPLDVLRGQEHGGSLRTKLSTSSHTSMRVRGSRPVVGPSRMITRGRTDQTGAKVEPARVAAREAIGGVRKTERVERRLARRPGDDRGQFPHVGAHRDRHC